MALYPEVPDLLEENIKPFGIKSLNKTSFPVSALQSFFSLPKFINCINSIIEKKNDTAFFYGIKKKLLKKNTIIQLTLSEALKRNTQLLIINLLRLLIILLANYLKVNMKIYFMEKVFLLKSVENASFQMEKI